MDSDVRPPTPPQSTAGVRRVLGPRPVIMSIAAMCVIGVVIALAQLVRSSQESSRTAARERFANGAVVRAQLTASLLATLNASLRSRRREARADARRRSTPSRRPRASATRRSCRATAR